MSVISAGNNSEGAIGKQSASYRQGLVLGLTMAEVMILLVFCLLIALTAFLKIESSKRVAAEEQLKKEQEAAAADRDFINLVKMDSQLADLIRSRSTANDQGTLDEFWRELVEGRSVVTAAKQSGLTSADIRSHLSDLKTIKEKGLDVSKAVRDSAIADRVDRAFGGPGRATPDEVTRAIERGLKENAPIPKVAPEGNKWPPIISLNDANNRFFKTGSAEVDADFRQLLLGTTVPRIAELIKEYDVDVIEVVGHTDEQALGARQSNLDRDLVSVLNNISGISAITPADNAGLGLARAVSVVGILRQSGSLSNYKILPLSGGQLINTDETLALAGNPGDIRERRRIEIRLRKATPKDAVTQATAQTTDANRSAVVPNPKPRPQARPSTLPAPKQIDTR